jgi:hypothetical protein
MVAPKLQLQARLTFNTHSIWEIVPSVDASITLQPFDGLAACGS